MLVTYTIPQAAEQTGIPETALYKAIRDGKLKARKPKGQKRGWRVTEREIKEYWDALE